MAGVELGVAVIFIVISVMSGFDKQLRDTFLGFNAHTSISRIPGEQMSNYRDLMSIAASNQSVRGVAPFVTSQVLHGDDHEHAHTRKIYDSAPYLRGIDPEAETNVSSLATSIIDGKFDVSGHGILIGSVLADNLGIQVGDTVNISTGADVRKMR